MHGCGVSQEYEVCTVAVGLVGDMSRALGRKMEVLSDSIMGVFLSNLQNPQLDDSVRPPIMASFGDLAMAVGGKFLTYLEHAMAVLFGALQYSVDTVFMISFFPHRLVSYFLLKDDEDSIDYFNEIRHAVLDACVGILSGLHDDNKRNLISLIKF